MPHPPNSPGYVGHDPPRPNRPAPGEITILPFPRDPVEAHVEAGEGHGQLDKEKYPNLVAFLAARSRRKLPAVYGSRVRKMTDEQMAAKEAKLAGRAQLERIRRVGATPSGLGAAGRKPGLGKGPLYRR